jgi:hypothetical protein
MTSESELKYEDNDEEETQTRFHRKYTPKIRQFFGKKAKQLLSGETVYYKGKQITGICNFSSEVGIPRSTLEGWSTKSWKPSKVKVSKDLNVFLPL